MLHIQLLHLRRFCCLLCGLKRTDKKRGVRVYQLHRVCRRLETDGSVTRATFGVSQRLEPAPRVSAVLQKLLHGLVVLASAPTSIHDRGRSLSLEIVKDFWPHFWSSGGKKLRVNTRISASATPLPGQRQ